MGPTERLISEISRQKHRLGQPIRWNESVELIHSLRDRLDTTSKELDLSPASLKNLESRLIKLNQSIEAQGYELDAEDLISLIREMAAYIGNVLVLHANGEWSADAINLWDTRVVFKGPWHITKEGKEFISPSVVFLICNESAWSWDTICDGGEPNIYNMYRTVKSRLLREGP